MRVLDQNTIFTANTQLINVIIFINHKSRRRHRKQKRHVIRTVTQDNTNNSVFTLTIWHGTAWYGIIRHGTLTFDSVNWYLSELKHTVPGSLSPATCSL